MTTFVSVQQILELAPEMDPVYRDSFAIGQEVLEEFGIAASPLRVVHFMAQVLHETAALTMLVENLYYSAARLPVVWPTRFKPRGPLDPEDYAGEPRKLANEIYGGRMGNREPDDGFDFRGRGLLQLTGRDVYAHATRVVRVLSPAAPDFTEAPDLVITPAWCLDVAAAEWMSRGCNELADSDDIERITRRINGGLTGLRQRAEWAAAARTVWD
jgi:putative chitinase